MRSSRSRLRHAAGYQKHRAGCSAPPHHRELEAEAENVTSETVIDRIFAGLPVPEKQRMKEGGYCYPERNLAESKDPVEQPETS